ncbi:GspE/PulE family protein [Candidatus Uabimicrobium sp. HlEnr_7]|uniref:GspE/PulE family protein n=1 Tax=Candidatus Uabimicrobium helgolandensis TaxID=3095367 RepID=UPI00355899B5
METEIYDQLLEKSRQRKNDEHNQNVHRFLYSALKKCFYTRLSHIHIEPMAQTLRVRYRCGLTGAFHKHTHLPKSFPILKYVKKIARMNIAETSIPQSGYCKIIYGGHTTYPVRLFVSTLPCQYGESMVMHIVCTTISFYIWRDVVGIPRLHKAIENSRCGLFLATGPAQCGKTATMFSILPELSRREIKVITIENFITMNYPGLIQITTDPSTGGNYPNRLRAVLDHMPDVIFVGEILDRETAEIAMRAAKKCLVLATIPDNNDTCSCLSRFVEMGIDSSLISTTIRYITSQRLVLQLCQRCKTSYTPKTGELLALGQSPSSTGNFFRATGCKECNNGYMGRTRIHEVLEISPAIRELICDKASTTQLREAASEDGMSTLLGSGIEKLLAGETTSLEILRVLFQRSHNLSTNSVPDSVGERR